MNNYLKEFSLVEHFIIKHKDIYILLDVNTLDIYTLTPDIYTIIKFLKQKKTKVKYNGASDELNKNKLPIIKQLIKSNILIKKNGNIKNTFKFDPGKDIDTLDLLISQDCNLVCKYCFAGKGNFGNKNTLMDFETSKKAIDFLIQKSGIKNQLFVCFFGGEPLMNFDLMKRIVPYALEHGQIFNKEIYFSITTNGILFSKEIVEFCINYHIKVQISIDGDSIAQNLNRTFLSGKGSYDIVKNNLNELSNYNINLIARATVTAPTIQYLSENFEHLISLNFSQIKFENALAKNGNLFINKKSDVIEMKKQYLSISNKIIENIAKNKQYNFTPITAHLNEIIEKRKVLYSCRIGRGYVTVDAIGDIYLCHRLVGEKEFLLGNIHKGSLDSKWSDIIRKKPVNKRTKCKKCWAKYICGGGCYAINYEYNTNIFNSPKIYCELKKYSIKMAIIIYTSLLNQHDMKVL